MDEEIEATLKSLRSRNLGAVFTENSEDARNKIVDLIPEDAAVGIGDSTAVAQIGIKEELERSKGAGWL